MRKKHLLLSALVFFTYITQAQCTFGNDTGSFDPQNNFDWAQTFTAECDGFIEYVEFITGSGGTQQARTLEIFEGATVSGDPIYTQDFPETSFSAAGQSLRITLEEEFSISQGEVFTFQIPGVTVNLLVNVAANGNPDVYPEGFAWENGSSFNEIVDFVFNVRISDEALSLNDFEFSTLFAHPNPATNVINVSLGSFQEEITIRTFNFLGQLVMEENVIHSNLVRMDITSLAQGTYYSIVMTSSSRGAFRFVKS